MRIVSFLQDTVCNTWISNTARHIHYSVADHTNYYICVFNSACEAMTKLFHFRIINKFGKTGQLFPATAVHVPHF